MLNAINLDKDHYGLMDIMVCSRDLKECMIHCCPNCPADLENYLIKQLQPEIDEGDDNDLITIQFQQLTNVDCSELAQEILPVEEFISFLVDKLNTLTFHSYILKAQEKYLNEGKEEL